MSRASPRHHEPDGDRAAIYARVSDQSQAEDDKTSLPEQTTEMEAYCEDRGLTIVAKYQEVGRGGSKKRPEFQRMLADAKRGHFDTIVCWKSDRLSRGMYPAAELMAVVEAYGIRLEAVKDVIDANMFALQAVVGKIEIDNFRERASMGRRGMAKQGRIPSNEVPYGYRRGAGGIPEIAEEEAAAVRRIFQLCVDEGMGGKRIASQLTAEGVPTRKPGASWHGATVNRILKNETYMGTWWYGKQRHMLTDEGRRVQDQAREAWIPISFPPLVDEATWKKAQEARVLRTNRSKRNTRVFYMLQHLVRCSVCGMLFGARTTRYRQVRRENKVYRYEMEPPDRYYRCYGKNKGIQRCREHPYIRADLLEDLVWNEVEKVVAEPEVIISGINSLRSTDDAQLQERIREAERDLHKVKAEEQRLIQLAIASRITEDEFDQQRRFLAERRENLEASLNEYLSQESTAVKAWDAEDKLAQWTQAVREGLEALGPEMRREVLLLLVDHVTINGTDGVCITFSITIEKPGASYCG